MQGEVQNRYLSLVDRLNQSHLERHPNESDLSARISSYELAARMQLSAKEALDISGESDATKKLYRSLEAAVLTAVALVMITCVATLGLRPALMIGTSIPISFMIAFLVVQMLGMTINMIPRDGGKPRAWFASPKLDGSEFGTTGIVFRKQSRDPRELALMIEAQRLWHEIVPELDEDIGFKVGGVADLLLTVDSSDDVRLADRRSASRTVTYTRCR